MPDRDAPQSTPTLKDDPELPAWAQKLESIPQIDPVVLLGFAPVALYLLFDRIWDVRAAIASAVIAAVVVFIVQRRLRPRARVVYMISMLGLALMIGFAIAGLIWEDGHLFWTADPVDDFATAAIFLGSVLLGRPIVGPFARELFPQLADRLPGEHRVWRTITIVWGLKMLATGFFRLWLLDTIETDTYVWVRTLVAWPINLALFLWTLDRIRKATDASALGRARATTLPTDNRSNDARSNDASEVIAEAEVAER